jgi:hypothetical protein
MALSIRRVLVSNIFLKATALILGCMLWSILGEMFVATRWFKVPLGFYNTEQTAHIEAPESVWIQLKGKRSFLNHIDRTTLGAHINAQELKPGLNTIPLTHEQLLLPPALALRDYIPHNLVVTVR